MSTVTLEIPPQPLLIEPSLVFVREFANQLGMSSEKLSSLETLFHYSLDLTMEHLRADDFHANLEIEVFEKDGFLQIEILNRGLPIFLTRQSDGGKKFHELSAQLEKVSIENRGREGQTIILRNSLGLQNQQGEFANQTPHERLAGQASEDFVIRELAIGEEEKLSQLFYHVYGYQYINEFVYFPEKIRQAIDEGKLISVVASLPNGRLVGHVGLKKWKDEPPVYEPCLGVVDPRMKSKGLFGAIFTETMDKVADVPMHYLLFDFVTNHSLSQRFISRYKPVDLALFMGCQSKLTQAKLERLGLGEDSKEMDRYTLLVSILPKVKAPFGTEITLPEAIGKELGFLLKPLDLQWNPASRFDQLSTHGQFETQFQPQQQSVTFDCFQLGLDAIYRISAEWKQLLRNSYQYAAVDIPLPAAGLGQAYDLLAKVGFFFSGFVPYHYSGTLGIRFQAIGPTKVAWDDIKLHSEDAKRLLKVIRESHERNQYEFS